MSKNPYVVEARQNLSPKSPHLALKTDEKFTQTYRLKSLIFIVEKYGNKLLFGFLRKNTNKMLLPLQGVAFSANRKKIITDRKEREQLAVFGASCSLFCGLD
ncbi:MAG: hypothetical protein ACI3Z6_01590 [Candidatus Onthomorpha sp.]